MFYFSVRMQSRNTNVFHFSYRNLNAFVFLELNRRECVILSANIEGRKSPLRVVDVIFIQNFEMKSLRDHMLNRKLATENVAEQNRDLFTQLNEYKVIFVKHLPLAI